MNREVETSDQHQTSEATQSAAAQGDDAASPAKRPEAPLSPKPPKGPRVWVLALVGIGIVLGFVAGGFVGPEVASRTRSVIQSVSSNEQSTASGETDGSNGATADYYTCGMHPWVILPEPGLCPICHMELTPLDPSKFTGEISIDPVVTQNIGVRVEAVETGPIVKTIRTVGTVVYDETRVRDINIKVPGWIEDLYVDYEGVAVEAGDPLFKYYSPKLYSAQSEYLSALRMRGKIGTEFLPGTEMDAERLIGDARAQLEYFDISDEQIDTLAANGEPTKTMTLWSPFSGIIIEKHANEGMRVDQGMRVYRIADLTKVWVMVSLYEYQLPFVQEGQLAMMSLPYIPGQLFEGRVIYVYPYLDGTTRQLQVRLEFENPNLLLKPGMYASIELRNTLARERTIVTRSAVIDTGERQVAFVSLGEGRFEPREIVMGVDTDGGKVEILDGLVPGEMVVTSGQFLLDSESRIRESLAKMITGNLASEQETVVEISGASELASLTPSVSTGISSLLESYFSIGKLLSRDSTDGIAESARTIATTVDALVQQEIPDSPHFWHQHDEIATVRGKALEVAGSSDIEEARLAFADLSFALTKLVKATGVPPEYDFEVQELHCPMYRDGQGGSTWLQAAGDVRNPFYGSVMLECFDERSALPVTGQAGESTSEPSATTDPQEDEQSESTIGMSAEAQDSIDGLIGAYLKIQDKLTRDELDATDELLHSMHGTLEKLSSSAPESLRLAVDTVLQTAKFDTGTLESFRQGFRDLSNAMIDLVRLAPARARVGPTVYHAYCPMEKANWLQLGKEISNPYASAMLRCGSIKEEFDAVVAEGGAR